MPFRKIRFVNELKGTVKIIKETLKPPYHLIFFKYENINYLLGYSYNEKSCPFFLIENNGEFIITKKYIFTLNKTSTITENSLIPANFNFELNINDFIKKYIKKEELIQELPKEVQIAKKRTRNKKK